MADQCEACGASWVNGPTCQEAFDQMLAWDFTDPAAGSVHHLTVLCYHIQHPHLMSSGGLLEQIDLLRRFIVDGESPVTIRQQNRVRLSSAVRTTPLTTREGNIGRHTRPIRWTLTAPWVVKEGLDAYPQRVQQWARAILEAIQ